MEQSFLQFHLRKPFTVTFLFLYFFTDKKDKLGLQLSQNSASFGKVLYPRQIKVLYLIMKLRSQRSYYSSLCLQFTADIGYIINESPNWEIFFMG